MHSSEIVVMPALHRRVGPAPLGNSRWIAAVLGGAAGVAGGGLLVAFAPAVASGSLAESSMADAVGARDAVPRPVASLSVAAVLARAPGDGPAAALAPAQDRP
jgi:hypothetical protein